METRKRLCLHGLDVKREAQLLNLVKRLLSGSTVKYKLKEKYFNDNDLYKYHLARFTPRLMPQIEVHCLWGVLQVSDSESILADIRIDFDASDAQSVAYVEKLVRRVLASKLHFVLEEPNISDRIDQIRGCYLLENTATYDTDDALTAVNVHLPWQLYAISKQWAAIITRGTERSLLRQLRVKLRRFRSSLSLVKPLLPTDVAKYWHEQLRLRTNMLSAVREYDVLLMSCAKMELQTEESIGAPHLANLLTKLRKQAATRLKKELKLNALTLEIALLQLQLYSRASNEKELRLRPFLRSRLDTWSAKLEGYPDRYEQIDPQDGEALHRMRIKIKRFRYALQNTPEMGAGSRFLRNLKYLQDLLGLVHDDYVNTQMLKTILVENPKPKALSVEMARLDAWQQNKTSVALEQLPKHWSDFADLLDEWRDKNI